MEDHLLRKYKFTIKKQNDAYESNILLVKFEWVCTSWVTK